MTLAKGISMRTVSALIAFFLALCQPVLAATFSCEFSPTSGSTTPFVCNVDSTKITPCRQSYSPALLALCQGGHSLRSNTSYLRCYFADPGSPSLRDTEPADLAAGLAEAANAPGIHAVAFEWISTTPATDMALLYNKPGEPSRFVLCRVAP